MRPESCLDHCDSWNGFAKEQLGFFASAFEGLGQLGQLKLSEADL